MKRFNFIRDERGAILILGAFFLLFIGMWLLALSLDLPMTFNREQSAQAMIRQATSSAAKQIQYMKYSGSIEQALTRLDQGNSRVFDPSELPPEKMRGDLRSIEAGDPNDVKVSPNSTILWQGVAYNIEGSNQDFTNPDNLNAFLNKPAIIAQAEEHMRRVLENKMPKGACVRVPGVRQNEEGKNYLFAYMDYPDNSIFDEAGYRPKDTEAVATAQQCDCNNNEPIPGCSRVVSGQLFSDEFDSWADNKNDDGQPWEKFRNGLRTEIVVETSHQTLNAPFDFIGYTLTAIDEALGYEVGDDVEDTFAGWIRFGAMLHAPLANVDLDPNYIPDTTGGGTLKVGSCNIRIDGSDVAGDWTGCLAASSTDIGSIPDLINSGNCEYQAVQSSAYSPRIDILRYHSRACWDPVWSHTVETVKPVKCIGKKITKPKKSESKCGSYTKDGKKYVRACCEAYSFGSDDRYRCEGRCDSDPFWHQDDRCWEWKQPEFVYIAWDDECSFENSEYRLGETPEDENFIVNPRLEFRVTRENESYAIARSNETYFNGFYATFGDIFSTEEFHNIWLSSNSGAVSGVFRALGKAKLDKWITHEIFDFQGCIRYGKCTNGVDILAKKFWGPFLEKNSWYHDIMEQGPETVAGLVINDQNPITFIDGDYHIVPKNHNANSIASLPVGLYTIEARPTKLHDGNPGDGAWCGRPGGWMQGPYNDDCILDIDEAKKILAETNNLCPVDMKSGPYAGKTLISILQESAKLRCEGCKCEEETDACKNAPVSYNFDNLAPEFKKTIQLSATQDNPKQIVYIDKLFANSRIVESYGHMPGERKKAVQQSIAEHIAEGTAHSMDFFKLQVEDAVEVADYSGLYNILTYESFPGTGLLPITEAMKIGQSGEGEDWKRFMVAGRELPFGGTVNSVESYYGSTGQELYTSANGVSYMDGILAYDDTKFQRLGEVYVEAARCSGSGRMNLTTPFGRWNATRDHMREVLPNLKIEANGLNAGAWCPAIAMAVDVMLSDPTTDCDDPHQRCVLPLFVSEAPDDSQYLRDSNNNFANLALDAFTLDGELDNAGTIHYSRDAQYKCATNVLNHFKEQGGIVVVVGIEGIGLEEPQKFADWIAQVSGDVSKSFLIGQRGMFIEATDEDGNESGTVLSTSNGEVLNATKADVLQSLLWNYTPNTIEVCQGNSCE